VEECSETNGHSGAGSETEVSQFAIARSLVLAVTAKNRLGGGGKAAGFSGGWDPGGVDREGHGWKLTAITSQCEALATDAAAKGWTHVDYLRRLLEGSGFNV